MEIAQAQTVLGLEVFDSPEQTEKGMIFSGLRKIMRKLIDVQENQLMETLSSKQSRSKGVFSIKGSYHI